MSTQPVTSARFPGLNASFLILVSLGLVLLFAGLGALVTWALARSGMEAVTVMENRRALDTLKTVTAFVNLAARSGKQSDVNNIFLSLIQDQSAGIREAVLLSPDGKVLAHSDFTRVSSVQKDVLSRTDSEYNTELFQSALRLEESSAAVRPGRDLTGVPYLAGFFPGDLHREILVSGVLLEKGKPAATLHISFARPVAWIILSGIPEKLGIICGISSAAGLLLAALLMLAFYFRAASAFQMGVIQGRPAASAEEIAAVLKGELARLQPERTVAAPAPKVLDAILLD